MDTAMIVLCLAVGLILLGVLLVWKLIAIGTEEPIWNQKRKAWWNQ